MYPRNIWVCYAWTSLFSPLRPKPGLEWIMVIFIVKRVQIPTGARLFDIKNAQYKQKEVYDIVQRTRLMTRVRSRRWKKTQSPKYERYNGDNAGMLWPSVRYCVCLVRTFDPCLQRIRVFYNWPRLPSFLMHLPLRSWASVHIKSSNMIHRCTRKSGLGSGDRRRYSIIIKRKRYAGLLGKNNFFNIV